MSDCSGRASEPKRASNARIAGHDLLDSPVARPHERIRATNQTERPGQPGFSLAHKFKAAFSGSDTRHLLWQNARSRGSALECQSNYSCTVTSRINSNKSCCRESVSGLHFTFMTLSTQDKCVRGAPMIPLTHDAVLYDVAFGHVNTRLTEQVLVWWSHAVYESGLVLLTETDCWLPTMARLDLRNALC